MEFQNQRYVLQRSLTKYVYQREFNEWILFNGHRINDPDTCKSIEN